MATVPGDPNDPTGQAPVPPLPMLLMAGSIMHRQGKFQMAGDVVPFPTATQRFEKDPKSLEDIRKADTRATLSRVLGGTQNVLPMTPKGD